MKTRPNSQTIASLKNAARLLTGSARRKFQAEVTQNHCHGSPRFARELFGWNTDAIQKGIAENETNCIILDNRRAGRPSYLQKLPSLENDIRSLVNPNSCTHPTFETQFRYTRMTAQAVIDALVKHKNYDRNCLPKLSTMRELLGKLGYRLRRVQKTQPKKKFQRPMPFSQT